MAAPAARLELHSSPFPALTPAQRYHYEVYGFVVLPELLSAGETASLLGELQHLRATLIDARFATAQIAYNEVHPTWTATMALCDRPAARSTSVRQQPCLAFHERMRTLMQETQFACQQVSDKRARHRLRSSGGGKPGRGR